MLPRICKELDPGRLYWPSSPGHSLVLPETDQIYGSGDNHYWGVWHGGDGFEAFEENVGRFMSEYGMQSFPDIKTIKTFAHEDDLSVDSDVMKAHQKASLGTGNLIQYIEDHYTLNGEFGSTVILSQIMQAQVIRFAVESHRRNMPFCMGTLYWQFNDCWPVISWSSVDYEGNWKALHYTAKRFFDSTLISLTEKDGIVELSMADVSNGGIVTGAGLSKRRPIYVIRYQGFNWYNCPMIVNYACKSKEIWKVPCPVFVRGIAMEGAIGPVAGSSHHCALFLFRQRE